MWSKHTNFLSRSLRRSTTDIKSISSGLYPRRRSSFAATKMGWSPASRSIFTRVLIMSSACASGLLWQACCGAEQLSRLHRHIPLTEYYWQQISHLDGKKSGRLSLSTQHCCYLDDKNSMTRVRLWLSCGPHCPTIQSGGHHRLAASPRHQRDPSCR